VIDKIKKIYSWAKIYRKFKEFDADALIWIGKKCLIEKNGIMILNKKICKKYYLNGIVIVKD
jgi:hypothetical protein